jgi:hypothetical protein
MPNEAPGSGRGSLDDAIAAAAREVRVSLERVPIGAVGAAPLHSKEAPAARPGTKPLFLLENESGDRFILKIGPPWLMAAEQVAYELRCLGDRPAVPCCVTSVEVVELGTISGLLKAYIEFDSARELGSDTTLWTPLQRAVILREHCWEWFLDNDDTNTSQYALMGDSGFPLNIDWDRAFYSEGMSPLSRYTKYKRTLPNARTFLYADYVEGRVALDLRMLYAEASHIRALPDAEIARIAAALRGAGEQDEAGHDGDAVVGRLLERKARIEDEVRRFICALRAERQERQHVPALPPGPRLRVLLRKGWAKWQVAIHSVARGTPGNLGRRMLRLVRAYSAGLPRRLPGRARNGDKTATGPA